MRKWMRFGLLLAVVTMSDVGLAQESPGGRSVDIKRSTTANPPSSGSPAFNPVGALSGSGTPPSAGGSSSSPVEPLGTAAAPATAGTGAAGGGGLYWTNLLSFIPKPANYDVPPWWKLRWPKAESTGSRRPMSAGGARPSRAPQKAENGGFFQRIVQQANSVVGKRFNYAAGTQGGRLGCAQVVSTILKAAGAMKNVMLGVLAVVSDLRSRGWKDVKPPPYEDGDVITWATYDRTGDGRKDPDTHIGVISKEGNTVYAINNSSSKRHPVKVELGSFGYPVTRVMRKA